MGLLKKRRQLARILKLYEGHVAKGTLPKDMFEGWPEQLNQEDIKIRRHYRSHHK